MGGGLFTFYRIDTTNSDIAIAGQPEDAPAPTPDDPPPPPPPPPDPHPGIIDQIIFSEDHVTGQIVQTESNINENVSAQSDRAVSAFDAVRNALGIVEDNVQASIAGAVLNVNSTVASGIDRLAQRLGVPTQQLATAIQGNADALDTVQQTIVDQVIGPLREKIEADEIRIIANNLSGGIRNHDSFRPESLLKVVPIVGDAIQLFELLGIRPQSVVNRARAEFSRGLRKLRGRFITVSRAEHAEALGYFQTRHWRQEWRSGVRHLGRRRRGPVRRLRFNGTGLPDAGYRSGRAGTSG